MSEEVSYLGELRQNMRPLAAASLGTGGGLMLMGYTTTLFAPYLVRTFGWSRSQFALIGLAMFCTLIALPFIGRFTDRFGVRWAGTIGALGIPACLVSYSLMNGAFALYFAISCGILAVGSFSSPVVWTRLIAANFHKARGLALTIVTIAPAAIGTIAAPLLAHAIDEWGWRVGYRLLAVFVMLCALGAVALAPPRDAAQDVQSGPAISRDKGDIRAILATPAFWIIFAAMFLCTLQTPLHASQMALMLEDNSMATTQIAAMVSVYGTGTIIGRLACGLALDRYPARIVAAASMILPALGYALLATDWDTTVIVGISMFLVGIAFGAEGDLQSFLVARHFRIGIYSTALSLVYCGVFAASALGSVMLGISLKFTDSFAPFLLAIAAAVAVGSLLFLALPRREHGPELDAANLAGAR